MPNISRILNINQAMKVDQLLEHKVRNIIIKISSENQIGRQVRDLFLYFEKALQEEKASGRSAP